MDSSKTRNNASKFDSSVSNPSVVSDTDTRTKGDAASCGESEENLERKLFIGGLSWQTTAERLKDYFSKYGEIKDVLIMRDQATQASGTLKVKSETSINVFRGAEALVS